MKYVAGEPESLSINKVYLDSVEIEDVFECDPEEGYLMKYCRDQDGDLIVDRPKQEVVTETLFGKVEIAFK